MDQDQPYTPRPRSEQGGWIVGLIAMVALLLVLAVFIGGGLFLYRVSIVERQRALEAEQRARIEAEKARAEAELFRMEALRAKDEAQQAAGNAP